MHLMLMVAAGVLLGIVGWYVLVMALALCGGEIVTQAEKIKRRRDERLSSLAWGLAFLALIVFALAISWLPWLPAPVGAWGLLGTWAIIAVGYGRVRARRDGPGTHRGRQS